MYRLKFLFLLSLTNAVVDAGAPQCEDLCRIDIRRFIEFIGVDTTRGADFTPALDFWKRLSEQENVDMKVYEYVENNPVIVLTYPGLDSSLSSIVLNAHIDVVPANYEDGWKFPPYSGGINDQCEIVGRGTQNMKSNAMQYFEAMNRLKYNNVTLLRDVYIVFTPDQTTGSMNGGELFVKSKEFQEMNVGFAFTEGTAIPQPELAIFYRDKTTWVLRVDCYGQSTPSGLYLDPKDTAEGPCGNFFESYAQYEAEQYRQFRNSSDPGKYTVMTFLDICSPATYAVIPAHLSMRYAITLNRQTSIETFNETLQEWARRADGDIRLTTELLIEKAPTTKIDSSNPYWVALKDVFDDLNIPLQLTTAPGVTDANYIVKAGVPSFGVSPQQNTPLLVFAINERISIRTFLDGICIYEQLIERIANLSDDEVDDDPKKYIDYSET